MDSYDLYKLDYEKTLDWVNQLADIRFKLLALLPVATGTALGLTDVEGSPQSGLVIGLLGFFVTIGLLIYDQRNSEIYEKQMHRARLLELHLAFPPVTSDGLPGGPVGGRPRHNRMLLGKVEIWHDRGLAFIYSAVLGAWAYLISASTTNLIANIPDALHAVIPLTVIATVAGLCWSQIHKLDAPTQEILRLRNEIQALQQRNTTRSRGV